MLAPEQKIRGLTLVMTTAANFRMLETNPLQRVVQFDVDAQIIRIQLELVPRTDSAVLLHAHRKRGAAAFNMRYANGDSALAMSGSL